MHLASCDVETLLDQSRNMTVLSSPGTVSCEDSLRKQIFKCTEPYCRPTWMAQNPKPAALSRQLARNVRGTFPLACQPHARLDSCWHCVVSVYASQTAGLQLQQGPVSKISPW
jgi:hypothetical protein